MATNTILVNTFTNGILGPSAPMLGPVRDGGYIIANTAPGCWGPMITPAIRGGHEVTQPVAVEGAEIGDSIAIRLLSIDVTSQVTSSGVDSVQGAFCIGDPFVAAKCQNCGKLWPGTHIEGIGKDAIKCDECGATVAPFIFANGYTIAFDDKKTVAVTLAKPEVDKIAPEAEKYASLPEHSIQNPVTTLAPSDLPGIATRMRPFVGQLGTCPAVDTPDSHNAGFRSVLIGAPTTMPSPRGHRQPYGRPYGYQPGPPRRCFDRPGCSPAAAFMWVTCTACRATARSPATRLTRQGSSSCRCTSSKSDDPRPHPAPH